MIHRLVLQGLWRSASVAILVLVRGFGLYRPLVYPMGVAHAAALLATMRYLQQGLGRR